MNISDLYIRSPVPSAAQPAFSGAEIWKRRSVEASLRVADSARPTLERLSKNCAWRAMVGTNRTVCRCYQTNDMILYGSWSRVTKTLTKKRQEKNVDLAVHCLSFEIILEQGRKR